METTLKVISVKIRLLVLNRLHFDKKRLTLYTNMKKNEIKWFTTEYTTYSANPIPKGYPYKAMMRRGKVFPITKAQAMEFVKMGCLLDGLNSEDVNVIETLLNKHNMEGNYRQYTKYLVKLENSCDLDKALKLEYNF